MQPRLYRDAAPAAAVTEAECSSATISGGAGVGANACVFTNNVFTAAGPDGYTFTATLSEIQRVRAITLSAEAGGVHTASAAQYLRLAQGVYTDVAQNENEALITENSVLLVQETADTIKPVPLSAEIHYGEFWLKVRFSETIDSTPGSLIRLENLWLSKDEGGKEISLDVAGVTVTENDLLTVTINLVENVRNSRIAVGCIAASDPKIVEILTCRIAASNRIQSPNVYNRL